ncbi:oligosaccharide flippase family protein [Streptomyces bobili]|uniref:oligosaccharide flippase family protein n=1 Tax=Streptomyces bobili TaxID=67280 RepID=UPI00340F4FCA
MTAPEATARPRPEATASGVAATARGGWWGMAGSVANAVFSFLLVGLITRAVGAQGAGVIFTGVAMFTILSNTCKLGADTGLVRFVPRDLAVDGGRSVDALLRTALLPATVAGTVAAVPLVLFPSVATALLPQVPPTDATALIRLFGLFLPAATVGMVLLGAARGYGTVVPFVGVEQIGKPVLRVLIAIPVVWCAPSVPALASAWLLPSLAGSVAAWFALRRCRARRPTPRRAAGADVPWRAFWRFAAPRAVSSVFDIGAVWVGVILLSALATSREAGVYTAIGRIVTAGTLVQLAVRLAVAPELSRLLAVEKVAEARALHRVSTCWTVALSWPLFGVVACFPGTILSVFGPGFTDGSLALVVLCTASMVNVAVGNAQTVLLMAGRSCWHLTVTAVAFTVQLAVGVLVVPAWGVLGAAASWGAAIVVENVMAAVLVRMRLGFTTVDRGYVRALAVGLAVTTVLVASRLSEGDTSSGLAVGMVLGLCVFGITLCRYRTLLRLGDLVGALRHRAA